MVSHAIHQSLIAFPMGSCASALDFILNHVFDTGFAWSPTALLIIAACSGAGLVATRAGFTDWSAIHATVRATRIGTVQSDGGNAAALLLFALAWIVRFGTQGAPSAFSIVVEIVALGLAAIAGWFGGDAVDRSGSRFDEGAHPDTSGSLTAQPAVVRVPADRRRREG